MFFIGHGKSPFFCDHKSRECKPAFANFFGSCKNSRQYVVFFTIYKCFFSKATKLGSGHVNVKDGP